MEHLILRTVTYGVLHLLILSMNSLCTLILLLSKVVLCLVSFLVPLFQENTSKALFFLIQGTWYWVFLHQQVIIFLQKRKCLETTVFMQDGAPPHIARAVMAQLGVYFEDDWVIMRNLLVFQTSISVTLVFLTLGSLEKFSVQEAYRLCLL